MSNTCTVVIITLHADPFSAPGVHEGGGTHSYVRELMMGLASRGWPFAVFTRHTDSSTPVMERVSRHGCLVRIPIGPIGPMHKWFLNEHHGNTILRVRESMAEYKITPTVLHSIYWNSGRVAMDLSEFMGIPFVHTVISNGMRRELEGAAQGCTERVAIEKKVFQKAVRIFSISQEEKQDLVSLYNIHPQKIIVVGRLVNGVFDKPAHTELGGARAISPITEGL